MEELLLALESNTLDRSLKNKLWNIHPHTEVRIVLHSLIVSGKIDADEALVFFTKNMKSNLDYVFIICLALREGSNPNIYVTDNKLGGSFHILAYLHKIKSQNSISEDIFRLLLGCFLASGSSIDFEVWPIDDVTIQPSKSKITKKIPSVIQWLKSNNMGDIIVELGVDIRASVPKSEYRKVGILTGRLDLLDDEDLDGEETKLAIRAQVTLQSYSLDDDTIKSIVEYYPTLDISGKSTNITGIDYTILIECVNHYDHISFLHYSEEGYSISYALLNVALTKLSSVKILKDAMGAIILYAIRYGADMDTDQQSLLITSGYEIHSSVIEEYQQPKWKKQCRSRTIQKNRYTKDIIYIAEVLGYSYDEDNSNDLCVFLNNNLLADPDVIIKSLIHRQKLRIASYFGYPNEFISGIPSLVVHNQSFIPEDPYSYVDDFMVFHRDYEGKLYGFPSDMYEILLKNKEHPYIGHRLSEQVLDEISTKMKRIITYGLEVKSPITWSMIIDMVTDADTITEKKSQYELELMYNKLADYGISSHDLSLLSAKDIGSVMDIVTDQYKLQNLTKTHAITTFAYIFNRLDDVKSLVTTLTYMIRNRLPDKWSVETEIPTTVLRNRDLSNRRSVIVTEEPVITEKVQFEPIVAEEYTITDRPISVPYTISNSPTVISTIPTNTIPTNPISYTVSNTIPTTNTRPTNISSTSPIRSNTRPSNTNPIPTNIPYTVSNTRPMTTNSRPTNMVGVPPQRYDISPQPRTNIYSKSEYTRSISPPPINRNPSIRGRRGK